jgi:septum formation topological specificity factor MinE
MHDFRLGKARTCSECGKTDQEVPFYNLKSRTTCKPCEQKRMKIYRAQERLLALQAYGGPNPKCSCPGCSENRIEFLSIDHINGDGAKHREKLILAQKRTKTHTKNYRSPGGGVFFRWLRQNNYPSGYRVLCFNCNIGRRNGPCPVHETLGLKDPTIQELRKDILRKLVAGVKCGEIVLS